MLIIIEDINILGNLYKKLLLNEKKFPFFKKIYKKIALNQDDNDVAIGIIANPICLKKITLINIFKNTDIKEI